MLDVGLTEMGGNSSSASVGVVVPGITEDRDDGKGNDDVSTP